MKVLLVNDEEQVVYLNDRSDILNKDVAKPKGNDLELVVRVVETLRLLEFEGYYKVMTMEHTERRLPSEFRYPYKLVLQCIESMQKFNLIEFSFQWKELKGWLMQEDVPLGVVHIVCMTLWGNLSQELAEELEAQQDAVLPEWVRGAQASCSKECMINWTNEQFHHLLKPLQLRNSQQRAHVSQIIQYIESHYSERISFGELSKKLHLTRSYLSYLFKREIGSSFIHYLTNYRIERAKELLLSGQHMIYEVSGMVGYSDPAYFSRVFKKVTGVPPHEYV